jgi:large subunit ribosomal protein L10
MAITKSQKSEIISELKASLSSSKCIIIVHYRGISGKQLYDMRVSLKSKGCGMRIAKNTLSEIVVKDTDLNILAPYFKGPTAILYSQDPVSLSKAVFQASKELASLKVQVGFFEKALIKESEIESLSKLGSLEDVRASFLAVLTGTQSNFVRILNAPQSGLVSFLQNYASSHQ